jgi:hypothetical protein
MSGVDTAYAAGFEDSDVARVNSPRIPLFALGLGRQQVGASAGDQERD